MKKSNRFFKSAAALAMACTLAIGTVPAGAFAAEIAGDSVQRDGEASENVYVLMNIPYADFYRAEQGNNDVDVDAMSSATKSKTRTGSLAGGSYHVNSDGSDISGVTYPVMLGEGVTLSDLAEYTQITDDSHLEITVTNRGQTSTTEYDGKDALFESDDYSYYILSETPSYYKEVTKEGTELVFSAAVGERTVLSQVEATFTTESSYGDYQLDISDETLDAVDVVYGVLIETEEGYNYGLRHIENIWRISALSWCTGFTTAVHSCPTSSDHYVSMMGKTISRVTYYTSDGIYEIPLSDGIYVPVKFESTLSVEDAAASDGQTTISTGTLPDGFDAVYTVEGLDGVSASDTTLSFSKDAALGSYTLMLSDAKGIYASISADFTLYTEDMPVSYNNAKKSLVAEDESALAAYVGSISSVSVDGNEYAASGSNATVLINTDGTLVTDAEPFSTDADSYQVEVTATGYKNNLTFTYAKVDADALQSAVSQAKALNESKYTSETWKTMQAKLEAAENVLATQESQTVIDQAAADLNAAVLGLQKAAVNDNNSSSNNNTNNDTKNDEAIKAGDICTAGKLRYKVTDAATDGTGTVEVYAPLSKKAAAVTVPATITINNISYRVTGIGAGAFKKCTSLKKITIGANVTYIGKNAFKGDSKLKTVTVKSKKITSVGKAAFKGIGKKAVIRVPKAKLAAYKKLFKGKGQGKKVTIK